MKERFESKFTRCPMSGCWLWTACVDKDGYGRITVYTSKGKRSIEAHRIAWNLYRGSIPEGLCVLHHCDIPSCVNPNHLFLGTTLDNNKDRDNKGRTHGPSGERSGRYTKPECTARGEKHVNAKLTEAEVRAIRNDNRTQEVIAKSYGVTQTTVSGIKRRTKWAHIKENANEDNEYQRSTKDIQ